MKNILCVDTEEFTLNLLKIKVEGRGHSFHRAGDVETGFEAAKKVAPDLIISEILLPGEEAGVRFCQRLKGEGKTADIPLVILTRRKRDPKSSFMFNAWAVEYFEKPFSPKALFSRIDEILNKRK
jgi:DNA-binding response OmpR family regulator